MYGPRVGPRVGPKVGPAVGPAADELGSGITIVTDATSGKGVPLTQAEWDAVFDLAGVARKTVAHSWGFQDAAGNIVKTVGTDLTVAGAPAYQQAVAGWSRKGFRLTNNTAQGAQHAGGTGINPSATSALWFGLIDVTATAAAARQILSGGGAAAASEVAYRKAATTEFPQIKCMAATADGLNDGTTGGVRPHVLRYDRTNTIVRLYNDLEKLSGVYNAGVTDGLKGFGATIAVSAGMDVLLGAAFAGANAEWSDADVKAVLQAMNWTIPW